MADITHTGTRLVRGGYTKGRYTAKRLWERDYPCYAVYNTDTGERVGGTVPRWYDACVLVDGHDRRDPVEEPKAVTDPPTVRDDGFAPVRKMGAAQEGDPF